LREGVARWHGRRRHAVRTSVRKRRSQGQALRRAPIPARYRRPLRPLRILRCHALSCYWTSNVTTMVHMRQSIGVRELRRDLSEYLRRVEEGESFAVTSRGREVALLAPTPGRADAIGRLVADRDAIAPRLDLLEVEPLKLEGGPPLSALLDDVRADR